MQIDVHITVYLCYTTKKMTHGTATVPKMRFVGSNISFQFSHRMFLFTPWLLAISSRCLAALPATDVCVQQSHATKCLLPQLWTLLPCYCHTIKANFKTILPDVSQPASAGNVADLVNCKLISRHCMMPELWIRLLCSVSVILANETVIARIKSIKLLTLGVLEFFGS